MFCLMGDWSGDKGVEEGLVMGEGGYLGVVDFDLLEDGVEGVEGFIRRFSEG